MNRFVSETRLGLSLSKRWMCAYLAFFSFLTTPGTAKPTGKYLSPVALVASRDGSCLYVAEFTAKQVAFFDIAGAKVTKTIRVPNPPSGLALSPDGQRLYVTGAAPKGKVYVIDLKKEKIVRRIPVGHTPVAPVVSPDGKTLYVCNRFDNNVSVIALRSRKQIARVAVVREPVAADITPDGKLLFVANHLPAGATDTDYAAAAVSVIDTAENKVAATIQLPNGSTGLQGICISGDGRYAYATHVLGRYQLPTTQLERGWMNTNSLSVFDVAKRKLINTVLLDNVDLGAANPWAVACKRCKKDPSGKFIYITHAGTGELSVIDRAGLHEKLEKVAGGEKVSEVSLSPEDVPNDLAFLVGLRRRLKLTGKSPRGLAIIGTKVYIAEYFTDSIGVVNICPKVRPKAHSLALGPEKPLTVVRKGEMLFHDATLCFQHWQSCASCHPGDGRADGLSWDLLNDGMGNPKNTKSLLLAHKTPPAMITGVRDSAEAGVRAGIKHILFAVRPEADAVASDEYLKSLKAVPSPHLVKGKLSRAAKRGRKIFKKANCASCHPQPLYTDLKKYNLDSGKNLDKDREFDTPTLVEVWRTSPYLHDGRAVTIREMLTKYNPDDKHGITSGLTEKQIDYLAEFVLSQ